MSKSLSLAVEATSRTGGPGSVGTLIVDVIKAVGAARVAQDEYKRHVARGVEPADAVRLAFTGRA